MSLVEANSFAFSLATSLMVSIVVFRAGDGTLTVVRADDMKERSRRSSAKSIHTSDDRENCGRWSWAMAAGVSQTLWSMEDLCEKMDAVAPKPGSEARTRSALWKPTRFP